MLFGRGADFFLGATL